jgi:hypothetical protein
VAGKQPHVAVTAVTNALVGLLVARIVAKPFGKRAGIGAALVGVVAHEMLNKPVANALSELVR